MTTGFIPFGSEFLVNTETSGEQSNPAITSLADGGYVVTWRSINQDGDSSGVYAQRYDASGATVGGEFLVNTVTEFDQNQNSITSLADGGFVVTWTSSEQDGSSSGVYGQRYDATGVVVGGEFLINTHTLYDQGGSSVASLTGGGFVVTWHSPYQEGGGDDFTLRYGVYGQRYDAAGVADGDEFLVNTEIVNFQGISAVTGLADGGFVVTWESRGQDDITDSNDSGVYGQRYDAAGATVGLEFLINTEVVDSQRSVSVTSFADGGFVVTWTSRGQDGSDNGVYGQRFDALGATVGLEFQINTEVSRGQDLPSVTSLADGGFVVTWTSERQDGDKTGIYGQRYDALGDAVGAEFQINTETADTQDKSQVTALDNGGFVVTWTSKFQDGSGYGIYAQQFDAQIFGTSERETIVDDLGANWINGQDGNDTLKGRDGDDTIYGGAGADKVYGGSGADTLYGEKGGDTIYGGAGNDALWGNGGKDRLIGGEGTDVLTGGLNADTFVFSDAAESATNSSADVITDFEVGVDFIELTGMAAGFTYIGSAAFSGTAGEVRVVISGTDTLVRVDVDGDGSADTKIVLEGASGVSVGDFIL